MSGDPDVGKRAAAIAAVALVRDGMALGLGTGSTMQFVIEELGRRVAAGLSVACVPTSVRTEREARRLGIPLTDFASVERLDLCIDGADEIAESDLALIKGLGGALLREKIVAANSARFVVVADRRKLVRRLGETVPLPVEVVRFGAEATVRRLATTGCEPRLRLASDGRPFVSDGGNPVYDLHGLGPIADPGALDAALRAIPGVVTTGLFVGMARGALVADGEDVRSLGDVG